MSNTFNFFWKECPIYEFIQLSMTRMFNISTCVKKKLSIISNFCWNNVQHFFFLLALLKLHFLKSLMLLVFSLLLCSSLLYLCTNAPLCVDHVFSNVNVFLSSSLNPKVGPLLVSVVHICLKIKYLYSLPQQTTGRVLPDHVMTRDDSQFKLLSSYFWWQLNYMGWNNFKTSPQKMIF